MKTSIIFSATIFSLLLLPLSGKTQLISDKGDRYFDQNQFDMAVRCYQQDLKSGNRKAAEHAMLKLADCYRIMGEFEKAEVTYKKILKRKKKEAKNYLNYGLSLKNSAKYAEAKLQFEEYIKLKPEDPMGTVYLVSCDSAQKWLDETIGKEVKNLDRINTEHSEFSPVLMGNNKLCFSSSRDGSTKALISFDGGGDLRRLDLYSIGLGDLENREQNKKVISNFKGLNTPLHEGPAAFSANGDEVYFTRTVKGKRDKNTNEILGTLQVFYSKLDSLGHWSVPVSAFSFNSKNYSIGHPSLSQDGNTIFYMSDKPGGKGKTDIYYSVKQSNGSWSAPINAGPSVNTFGYEMFPFISPSGLLLFSSDAHPGMGQLDIFSAKNMNGDWTEVHNLKPPLNSIANDFGISLDNGQMRGVFSSDRFNGMGLEDIYSFSEELPLAFTLSNGVLRFEDKSIFDDLKYKLLRSGDSLTEEIQAVDNLYTVDLDKIPSLTLSVSKNGMPYNNFEISLQRDSLLNESRLLITSGTKPFLLDGSLYPPKNENKLADNKCLVAVKLSSESEQTEAGRFDTQDEFYFRLTAPVLQSEVRVKE